MPRTPARRSTRTTPTRQSSGKRKRANDDDDDDNSHHHEAPPSSSAKKRQKTDLAYAKSIMTPKEFDEYRKEEIASRYESRDKQKEEAKRKAAAMLEKAEARQAAQKTQTDATATTTAAAVPVSTTTATKKTPKGRGTSSAPAAAAASTSVTTTTTATTATFPNLSKAEYNKLRHLQNKVKHCTIEKERNDAKRELAALEKTFAARSTSTTETVATTPRRRQTMGATPSSSSSSRSRNRKPAASSSSRRASVGSSADNNNFIRPPTSYQQRRHSNPFNSPVPAAAMAAAAAAAKTTVSSEPVSTTTTDAPTIPDFASSVVPAGLHRRRHHHDVVDDDEDDDDELQEEELREPIVQQRQKYHHHEYVNDRYEEEAQQQQANNKAWVWAFAGAFAVALVSSVIQAAFKEHLFPPMTSTTTSTPSSVECYQNSPTEYDEGHPITVASCREVPISLWKPCPKDAVCVGGVIEQCGRHLTLNSTTGTSCVLSDHAIETVQSMKNLLHAWSVDDTCQPGGTPYAIGKRSDGVPLFYYTQLVGELESGFDITLLDIANDYSADKKPVFVWDRQRDGNIRIGLHPAQDLKLPPRCNVTRFLRSIRDGVMNIVIAIMSWVFASCMIVLAGLVDLLKETPILSSIGSVIGLIVVVVWKRKRNRQFILHESKKVRYFVNEMLVPDDQSMPKLGAMYIRDHILHNEELPYGATPASQERFKNEIWPEVLDMIQQDNRVLKFDMVVDGTTRQGWQWKEFVPRIAIQSPAGNRRARFQDQQ